MKTIGFIGGGRITKIFLQAFKEAGISFEKVSVFDTNSEVLSKLYAKFPTIYTTTDNLAGVVKSDLIMIALHPPVIMETLTRIKDLLNPKSIIVSLAPKLTIAQMTAQLDGFANIVRMNPSASTMICKGVLPFCFSPEFDNKIKLDFFAFICRMGNAPEVEESKLEAYAVIIAMGHTYFFFQIQKLKEMAIGFGLSEEETNIAITDMLYASGLTVLFSDLSYKEIDDLVPVKPLGEVEETIKGYYDLYLNAIYNKIKPVK